MRRRAVVGAGLAAVAAAAHAWSPDALHLMVAYPPGGISDRIARLLALQLEDLLGEAVVVENKPGAGGGVALKSLSRAAPDGRTLAFCAISPLALLPYLGVTAPDVTPVAGVMRTPQLLIGTPGLAATDFSGMVALARARPGELRWATSGVGTIGHLVLDQVCRAESIQVTHVPYTGGGPQLQDALAGRFEVLSSNLAPLQIEYVRAGRFTPLALGAPERASALPGLPTLAELGCPGANRDSLFGVFAPPGTSAAIVGRINASCADALHRPALHEPLIASGNLPYSGSPDEFAQEIARQSSANRRALRPGA